MRPEDFLIQLVKNFQILAVVKFFLLFFLSLYVIFAIVIIRQVSLMDKTFKWSLNPFIKLVAWSHLVVVIIIWIYTFAVL